MDIFHVASLISLRDGIVAMKTLSSIDIRDRILTMKAFCYLEIIEGNISSILRGMIGA